MENKDGYKSGGDSLGDKKVGNQELSGKSQGG